MVINIIKILHEASGLPILYWIVFATVILGIVISSNGKLQAKHILAIAIAVLTFLLVAFVQIQKKMPDPDLIFKGYIRDYSTNAGVAGANVSLPDYPDMKGHVRKTNKDGYFEFRNLDRERTTRIVVSHEDYVPVEINRALSRTNNDQVDQIFVRRLNFCLDFDSLSTIIQHELDVLDKRTDSLQNEVELLSGKNLSTLRYDTLINNANYFRDSLWDLMKEVKMSYSRCAETTSGQQKTQLSAMENKLNYIMQKLRN